MDERYDRVKLRLLDCEQVPKGYQISEGCDRDHA